MKDSETDDARLCDSCRLRCSYGHLDEFGNWHCATQEAFRKFKASLEIRNNLKELERFFEASTEGEDKT